MKLISKTSFFPQVPGTVGCLVGRFGYSRVVVWVQCSSGGPRGGGGEGSEECWEPGVDRRGGGGVEGVSEYLTLSGP